jgi:hypothetical protein
MIPKSWELVRVYVKDGGRYETIHSSVISFAPEILEEKVALLKLTPATTPVDGVGRRINTSIFYVRLYPHEFTVLGKE